MSDAPPCGARTDCSCHPRSRHLFSERLPTEASILPPAARVRRPCPNGWTYPRRNTFQTWSWRTHCRCSCTSRSSFYSRNAIEIEFKDNVADGCGIDQTNESIRPGRRISISMVSTLVRVGNRRWYSLGLPAFAAFGLLVFSVARSDRRDFLQREEKRPEGKAKNEYGSWKAYRKFIESELRFSNSS